MVKIVIGLLICWYVFNEQTEWIKNPENYPLIALCLCIMFIYWIYKFKDRTVYTYYHSADNDCIKTITEYKNFKIVKYKEFSYPSSYIHDENDVLTFYNVNALEYSVEFKNGVKNGYEKRYYIDDSRSNHIVQIKRYSCFWKNGVKDGKEIAYDREGNEEHIIYWENNQKKDEWHS